MRKSHKIWLLLGVLVLLVVGIRWWSQPKEPVYEGKRLTEWLDQYGTNHWAHHGGALDKEAERAIRGIGTNATPMLLEMLATAKSPTLNKILPRTPKPWFGWFRIPTVNDYQHRIYERQSLGAYGLGALGEKARPTVPALIEMLNTPDPDVRYHAVFTLRCLGPVAREALPSLIKCLDDPEFVVRDDAAASLGTIHADPERVVPILMKFIEKYRTDEVLCGEGMWALRAFGPEAKPAIPLLLRLLDDDRAVVRGDATNALRQIDREAAAKAGVK